MQCDLSQLCVDNRRSPFVSFILHGCCFGDDTRARGKRTETKKETRDVLKRNSKRETAKTQRTDTRCVGIGSETKANKRKALQHPFFNGQKEVRMFPSQPDYLSLYLVLVPSDPSPPLSSFSSRMFVNVFHLSPPSPPSPNRGGVAEARRETSSLISSTANAKALRSAFVEHRSACSFPPFSSVSLVVITNGLFVFFCFCLFVSFLPSLLPSILPSNVSSSHFLDT
mmetsp:Transcript_26075/g.51160  ORF Transcript_26075/g.51160 Transcript_26075/m.51160 type:complete len:226 (+) Transcript_26075:290-967(+)